MPKFFQPGDGIHRAVITADIERYLGRGVLVRPGRQTDDPDSRMGYWITADRPLTAEMVGDLKQDSERWRQKHGDEVLYQERQSRHDRNMARIRYTGLHPLRDDNGKEIRLSSGDAYRGPFGHGFYGPSITTNYAYSAPQGSYSSYPQYTPPGYYIASDGRMYPLTSKFSSQNQQRRS